MHDHGGFEMIPGKYHKTKECYFAYIDWSKTDADDCFEDCDEICEQLWAEVKIMRTLRVRDLE